MAAVAVGCLEQYALAAAITHGAKLLRKGSFAELERLMPDPAVHLTLYLHLAVQGDPSAKRIFDMVGFALGIGIGGMVNALNLPMYVIGGGVASSWDAFAPAMFKEMKFRSSIYSLTSPDQKDFAQSTIITRALLGSDAGLYGAARLPMLEGFTQMEKARTHG